jgi:seryl-tRNA synthetase
MLELQRIHNQTEAVKKALSNRIDNAPEVVDQIISLDNQRKNIQSNLDDLLAKQNKLAKDIGAFFKAGNIDEANKLKGLVSDLKEESQALKDKQAAILVDLDNALYTLPNVPNDSVPIGKTENDNKVIDSAGQIPDLGENKHPHWDLTSKYGMIDFERGVKVTGAGFPIYRGKGAKLQRALIQFFLDEASNAGYEEVIPPHMVNEASGYGTGQLPDKEGQMYHVTEDDLYLIPTAEVPLTNLYRGDLLAEDELPIKICGYSPCFRREAGSYGKDVRGLNRLHQFDKVEIVRIEKPENSYAVLNDMVDHVKNLLTKLELPFRVLQLCTGDLGFTSAITFDLEVYSAAQERWLEVSSVSNFETFQANRLKLRYKNADKKNQLLHTLNGSALALPRIMAALIENNQSADGIRIPAALHKYTGFEIIN